MVVKLIFVDYANSLQAGIRQLPGDWEGERSVGYLAQVGETVVGLRFHLTSRQEKRLRRHLPIVLSQALYEKIHPLKCYPWNWMIEMRGMRQQLAEALGVESPLNPIEML
jgi:hypothetical protein